MTLHTMKDVVHELGLLPNSHSTARAAEMALPNAFVADCLAQGDCGPDSLRICIQVLRQRDLLPRGLQKTQVAPGGGQQKEAEGQQATPEMVGQEQAAEEHQQKTAVGEQQEKGEKQNVVASSQCADQDRSEAQDGGCRQ